MGDKKIEELQRTVFLLNLDRGLTCKDIVACSPHADCVDDCREKFYFLLLLIIGLA